MEFLDYICIQNPYQTINKVIYLLNNKIPGAYLRFGDGDVNLLENTGELLQPSNSVLAKEMFEAFTLGGEGIMKCLPLHSIRFGQSPGMKHGLHSGSDDWAEDILLRTYRYFIGEKIYSHVALSYLAVFDYDYTINFLKFLKTFEPIFVGNSDIPIDISKRLFGENCIHIKTPTKASYSQIDNIERELLEYIPEKKFSVIVVAMGCSGRVLEKRILKKGLNTFLFDFGSLMDIFCGWNTRAWIDLVDLPGSYRDKMLNDIDHINK